MAQAQVAITAVDKTQAGINSAMRGLKGLGDQASLLKKTFASLGTIAVGQFLTRTASQAIQYGDELNKAAIKSGLAAESLSTLAYAAKQSDIDLGSLSTSIRKMQIALSEASTGGKSQKEALDALGLSIKDLQGLDADRQFELLADRISMLQDPADRARAAVALFGKSGAELLPLFEQGAEGIRMAREEAERLGLVLSDQQVQALAEADDALKRFTQSWEAFSAKIVSKVAPALTSILDVLNGVKGAFSLIPGFDKMMIAAGGLPAAGSAPARPPSVMDTNERANPRLAPGFRSTIEDQIDQRQRGISQQAFQIRAFYGALLESEQAVRDSIIETSDEVYNQLQEISIDIPDLTSKTVDVMAGLAEAAAQNIQSAFANFLFDPFEGGLRGMLSSFVTTIRRMVAEIASTMILSKFFTWMSGFGGFFGDVGSAGLKVLQARAMGGPVSARTPYLVGERGPELFVPGTSGGIVPNNKLGMGGGVTGAPVYNIDARGATADLQRSLPGILQENNRRIFDELDRRYGIGR